MRTQDIEDTGKILIINISDTKTHTDRTFVVTNERYSKGRCFNQNVGINKIGEIPSKIAQFLGKNDPKKYTGHTFRRTSATLLADSGSNITCIKRHGGWKSTSVAEGYIEDSLTNKIMTCNKISDCQAPSSNKEVHNELNDEFANNVVYQPSASNSVGENSEPDVEVDKFLENVLGEMSGEAISCQPIVSQPSSVLSMSTKASSASSGINVGNNCSNCTINFYYTVRQ